MLDGVKKLAQEVCEREQCVLWDVELKGAGRNRVLRVMIEGQNAQVSIQDCERVSKGLNLLLDVNDVVPGGAYNLEVSSPGIERHLREAWQFQKSIGSTVDILFNEPMPVPKGDPLRLKGTIVACDADKVFVLNEYEEKKEVPLTNVKSAKTVFKDTKSNKRTQ